MHAAPALAQQQRPPSLDDVESETFMTPDRPIPAERLLEDWGLRLGRTVVAHPSLAEVMISFQASEARLTWGLVKRVLDAYGVEVVEEEAAPGQMLIRACRRRAAREAGPTPPYPLFDPDDPLPRRAEVVTAFIAIKHGAGREVYNALRSLLQKYQGFGRSETLDFVAGSELLIATGPAPRVDYMRTLARAIDRRAPGQELRLRRLKVADAEEMARSISSIVEGGAGPFAGAAPLILAHKPTRTLILKAYDHQLAELEALIDDLDIQPATDKDKYHVYKCRNADARELAVKLQELVQVDVRKREGAGRRSAAPPRRGGGQAAAKKPERVDIRIVADPGTNALLIQAEDEDFREVLSVLRRLDKKRRRVFIEAMVWEISASDNLTFAAELAALSRPASGRFRPLAATSFGLSDATVGSAGVGRNVINRLGQGITGVLTKDRFDQVPVIVNALNQVSRSKTITTPYTVTNDNQEATFRAVTRQPFSVAQVGTFFSQQTFDFAEAPTTLDVLPQVNNADSVTLDLNLQVATFGLRPGPNLPPQVLERRYSGRVTVPNGRFVVFGGLDQESEIVSESKVPFIGDIPVLGHLFKSWRRTKVRTRVYVFIRPVILTDRSFRDDLRLGELMRKKAHVDADREQWLPPLIPERGEGAEDLQDKVFEVFGTGSGNPFRKG